MDWADQNGVSYLAWGWAVGVTPDCSEYWLVDENGNAVSPNGTLLQAHLAALAAGDVNGVVGTSASAASTTTTTTTTTATTPTAGSTTTTSATKPQCVVPRVIGDTLAQARTRLKRAHCAVGKLSYRRAKDKTRAKHPKTTVISQSQKAKRRLKAGAKINLVLQRH
jgi:hypothetical protein